MDSLLAGLVLRRERLQGEIMDEGGEVLSLTLDGLSFMSVLVLTCGLRLLRPRWRMGAVFFARLLVRRDSSDKAIESSLVV